MQNARATIQDCYSILVSSPAGGTTTGSECWSDFIAMHSVAFCAIRAMHSSAIACNAPMCILCISCNAFKCICVQCTPVHFVQFVQCTPVHLCEMHSGAFVCNSCKALRCIMHNAFRCILFHAIKCILRCKGLSTYYVSRRRGGRGSGKC